MPSTFLALAKEEALFVLIALLRRVFLWRKMRKEEPSAMEKILGIEITDDLQEGDELANGWTYLGSGDDENTVLVNMMGLVWDGVIVDRKSGRMINI